MSTDYVKYHILDDRLCLSDSIKYGVYQSGQNCTVNTFEALSKSTSTLTFNIQVPSEQTVIDRRVLLRNKFKIRITGTPAVGQYLVNLGSTDALAPFPVHQMISTAQITVNNNTVNLNVQDVINVLLRSNDIRELAAYNSMCPTYLDAYLNYGDATLANNNPLGGFANTSDPDLVPRGAFQVLEVTGNTVGDGASLKTVDITYQTTEPVLVSPFIFADPKSNNQGILGVQNMNFVFNFASNANRAFRSGSATAFTTCVLQEVVESALIFNFITPKSSQLLPARNVCPYYSLPRYITTISGVSGLTAATTSNGVLTPTSGKIQSNSLQLSQIPDKLIIFVRKQIGSQSAKDSDSFLPIRSVSINFNNLSGILSSATKQNLYQYSRESGYNGDWNQWSGVAYNPSPAGGDGVSVPTSGSMLMLEFGRHINLPETWFAPGSIGNFNLQFSVDVENYSSNNYSSSAGLELVVVTMNSGLFIVERGTTSVMEAILTRQDVLDAANQEPYSNQSVIRMVGGGFFDKLKTVAQNLLPKALPVAKAILGQVDNPMAKRGAELIGSLGYGRSGGRLQSRVA